MVRFPRFAVVFALLASIFIPAQATWAILTPDQIVLVVNDTVPESRRLAEYYAKVRGIPQGRIIALTLPAADEISFDQYESDVFAPIRRFLIQNKLENQVTCLVTFYGVPLRVGPRLLTREQRLEITDLTNQMVKVRPLVDGLLDKLEDLARKLDPAFNPERGFDIAAMSVRADRAFSVLNAKLATMTDPGARQTAFQKVMEIVQGLAGPVAVLQQEASALQNPSLPDEQRRTLNARLEQLGALERDLADLRTRRGDPAARSRQRDLVRQYFGLLAYSRLLDGQLQYFKPEQTVAALDSELALLWWDYYLRANWITNPLYVETGNGPHQPVLMVARLDGPQAGNVRDMIAASLKAEKEGLQGRIAIDARGIPPINAQKKPDGYGQYDQTLRNLAEFVKTKTKMPLTLDDKPEVFAAGSVKGVALYVGWYSLRNYVPAFAFSPGAVGYHIASFELTTLRGDQNHEWVHGLIGDGVAATLGPVDEPYTLAFPRPDLFFPLLMAGRLTLAEVYWHTQPTASWRVTLIGDPLYRPFAANPAVDPGDLPGPLRSLVEGEKSPPATSGSQGASPDGR